MDAGSHTAEETRSQLFVGGGIPIKLFVDPGSVFGRPKLVTTLKSAGAVIASDPKDSDFILVQSDLDTGAQFVRDWGVEKKVLEATWVSRSLSAGRPLKESDQWGGCLAVVGPEDPGHNPLPTPRISPPFLVDNSWPPNPPPPHTYAHHSSQQSSGSNGHSFPNNALAHPMQQPLIHETQPPMVMFQNQMPQMPLQPGGSQPFYPQQPMFQHQMAQAPLHPGGPQQYPQQYINDAFHMALLDIVQRHGFMPAGTPAMNPMPNPTYSQPPGLIPQAYNQSPSPSVDDPLPPSLSRKASVDLKGKGKATYVSRGSSSSFRASSSTSSAEKIFTAESGEPLTFYVAIDVNRRADILSRIKKNGGQISTQTTADFAILSFRSKDFEILLKNVLSAGGTAIKPAFVLDSVEQNVLLDAAQYEFEAPPKLVRQLQKSASRSPVKKEAGSKQKVKTTNSHKAVKKVGKEKSESPGVSRAEVRSPSPPPGHTRVLLSGDKYRYPEIEDQYALRYAAAMFSRDRHMSYTTLAAKLHGKMPHHSATAWMNRISKALRDEVEEVRKRAMIAYRKENYESQSQQQRSTEEDPPAKRARPSTSSNIQDVELDLNAVVHFFAYDGGDQQLAENEQDDPDARARIWQKLAEKTPCRTEGSWEDFFDKHHKKIMAKYEELVPPEDVPENPVE